MEKVYECCCGLEVHKKTVSAVMQYSLPVVTENSLPPRLREEEGRWKN